MKNYDDWKLSSGLDEAVIHTVCYTCGEEIYEGEEVLYIDGDHIHEYCFFDYAWNHLSPKNVVAGEK